MYYKRMFKHTLYKNVQHFTVFYFHAVSYLFSATFELDPVAEETLISDKTKIVRNEKKIQKIFSRVRENITPGRRAALI